jgi:hypothetical protein
VGGDWILESNGDLVITAQPKVDFQFILRDLGSVGGGQFGFGIFVEVEPFASAVTLIPEPSTASLLALGLVGLAARRRRLRE